MKKLLNTLYVLTPDSYLFCRNENICVRIGDMEKLSVPALNIDSIVCFGKMTKAGLEKIICKETDSIRIYRLGNSYRNRIEVIGRTGLIETGEPLLL